MKAAVPTFKIADNFNNQSKCFSFGR